MLHLFGEAADAVELAGSRDEGVFRFRHGFGDGEKLSFDHFEWTVHAFGDGLGGRLILGENS